MKNNKGFSLVELIVVIAIMAILAAVAIPTFATFINKANVASDVSFINDLTYSAELAHAATADKVKENSVKVTVDDKGNITKAEYIVQDDKNTVLGTITITVASGKATKVEVSENSTVDKSDAETAVATIDWSYKFKSTKAEGFCQIDADDAKKLTGTATGSQN